MALIEREKVWELVGEMAETVRPGSKLEGVMRRYANAIDNAPAVDAIPMEWLRKKREGAIWQLAWVIDWLLSDWQKEQEAQDG